MQRDLKQRDFFGGISEFRHNLAVYTTYTIDWDVVEKLREHSTARTVILHDKMQGFTAKNTYENRVCMRPAKRGNISEHYAGIFHAKVALLIGESTAAVCIGSLNLSRGSFDQSKDVCAWVEVERDSSELAKLTTWLSRYFPAGWEIVSKELRPSRMSSETFSQNWHFIENSERPLSGQIVALIRDSWRMDIQRATSHIASPFWAGTKHKSEVREWLQDLSAKRCYVYSRYNKTVTLFADENVSVKFPQRRKQKDNFHSKLVMFEWELEQMALIFIGSANFTHEGFFLSEKDGGNAECGLVIKLTDAEYRECRRWFEEGWEAPRELTGESVELLPEFSPPSEAFEPYMWAELEQSGPPIKLYVVAQRMPTIEIVGRDNKTRRMTCEGNADADIFTFLVSDRFLHKRDDKTVLEVKLNGEGPFQVPLFEIDKFEGAYYNDGCSLFKSRYEPKVSRGNKIRGEPGGQRNQHIVNPPDLEEFHKLWRDRFESLRRHPFFSMKHLEELQETFRNTLERGESGKGLYIAYHLARLKSINANEEIRSMVSKHREKFRLETFRSPDENSKWEDFVRKQQ